VYLPYLPDRQFAGKAGKYMVRVGRFNIKWTDIDMPGLELVKLISHFAQSNKAEGKSPKTIGWYTEMLTDYVRFPKATGATAGSRHMAQ
jgi:hypothetical protein